MKSFKHWLLTEDFATSDSSLTGDLMYPTSAGDYVYAANNPQEFSWLQWKWDQERKQGRKFHNINQKEFDKRGFVTLKSVTMPENRWIHKPDSRPNIAIDNINDLPILAIGKNSYDVKELAPKTMVRLEFPLDQIFNDKPSGSWPDAALDTKWTESLTPEGQNEFFAIYLTVSGRKFEVWIRRIDANSARITWLRGGPGVGQFTEVLPKFKQDLAALGIKNIDYSTALDDKTNGGAREKLFSQWLQKSKFQEDMLPYDPVDGNLGANSQMGIPSKYIGPDETGEKDPKRKQPLANFGFNRKNEKLKKRLRRA